MALEYDNDVNHDCKNEITKCKSIQSLSKRFRRCIHRKYNHNDYTDRTKILNDFHHILIYHDAKDDEFDYMLNAFGGTCDLEHCKKIRRHYKVNGSNEDNKFIEHLFDRIHCYVQHGYDAFRLTTAERE
eukprot:536410_1